MLGRKKGRGRVRVRIICHPPPPALPKTRPISSSLNTSLWREKTFARPKKTGKGKHYLGSSLAIEWAQKSFAVEIGLQGVFTHVTSRFQICCNKRKRLHHKKRVHLPQDTNMATVLMFTNISNMADLTSCGLDLRFLFLSFFLASTRAYVIWSWIMIKNLAV